MQIDNEDGYSHETEEAYRSISKYCFFGFLILLALLLLAFLTRPRADNLLAVSIFGLGFLAAVVLAGFAIRAYVRFRKLASRDRNFRAE